MVVKLLHWKDKGKTLKASRQKPPNNLQRQKNESDIRVCKAKEGNSGEGFVMNSVKESH